MGYREEYYKIVDRLKELLINYYKERLISIVIFGSVAKDTFRPDSDIDLLIIARNLVKGRLKRVKEFEENVECYLEGYIKTLAKNGIHPYISPVIKTPEEVEYGSPLFLDMTEDAKILYDKDNFFHDYIEKLKKRLSILGAKRIPFKGGYYWDLKPDYKPGDVIEL